MRILVTFLLLITFTSLFAQRELNVLRPAELVAAQKSKGSEFTRLEPFTPLSQQKANGEVKSRLSQYDLLQLETETLKPILKNQPNTISLTIPGTSVGNLELELVKVNIFTDDFSVIESGTETPAEVEHGVHYRGIIKGDPASFASVSIFKDEVMALISPAGGDGNLVVGKLEEPGAASQHIVYNDRDVAKQEDFVCETPDSDVGYALEDLRSSMEVREAAKCVRIYFEVDYDLAQNKGGTSGVNTYVTALFNQVATLYANDQINVQISQIYVWSTPSPYSGTSSSTLLNQFQQQRTSINGDIGQLLSFKASGGIAVLSGLCYPYTNGKLSFASIGTSFSNVPTYSWTVEVVTHELGHLLGSNHTHACVWNGNNTAIDGCAGFVEGNCAKPGNPSGGGTIMSYCHLTNVGINFNLGFGQQPGNVIRNKIAAASCVQTCTTGGGDGGNGGGGDGGNGGGGNGGGGNGGGGNPTVSCTQNQVIFKLLLDGYPMETTWRLKNASGAIVEQGGPYTKGTTTQIRDTFCLPNGCYTFEMLDEYGDGICCAYGNGAYSLTTASGQTIKSGGNFGSSETSNFCLPIGSGGGGNGGGNPTCVNIDFKNFSIQAYGAGQDIGTYQLLNNGTELRIMNNAWKALSLNYTVTANTKLEFEFGSTVEGEVHGIGFDNDDNISANRTFKLHGFQSWGILNYDNYPNDRTWRKFVIPVGQYYTGVFDRLFFVADNDSGTRTGDSFFRRIKIYEGSACQSIVGDDETFSLVINPNPAIVHSLPESFNLSVSPNPASNDIKLDFRCKESGNATIQIYNIMGQQLQTLPIGVYEGDNQERVNVSGLPPGTYYVRIDTRVNQLISKFIVSR